MRSLSLPGMSTARYTASPSTMAYAPFSSNLALSFCCRLLKPKLRLRQLTPRGTLLWQRVDPQAQHAHTQPAGDHQQVDAVEQRHGARRVAQYRERQRDAQHCAELPNRL